LITALLHYTLFLASRFIQLSIYFPLFDLYCRRDRMWSWY